MRFVKISQSEVRDIRELYEGVMSQACYGLFYREGKIIGREITDIVSKSGEDFFVISKKLLKGRGWVDDISFTKDKAEVKGSIEVSKSNSPTCHRLRGIISNIYEAYLQRKVYCKEVKCESSGGNKCVFEIEVIDLRSD
jgi:predicted hydrocarbon binding protein